MPPVILHTIGEFRPVFTIIGAVVFIYWTIWGSIGVFCGHICTAYPYPKSKLTGCVKFLAFSDTSPHYKYQFKKRQLWSPHP